MNSDNERNLQRENQSLTRLVACSLDGIIMTDEQGRIVEWNPALEQLTGIPYSSVAGQHIWEILSRLTPAPHQSSEQAALEKAFIQELLMSETMNGSNEYHERQIQGADQTIRTVEVSVFTVPTDHGYRLANIIRDVTSSRAAERQLRTLLRAVEQSPTTVVITDSDGHIEYANPRLTELTGYTLDEVCGKTPRVFKSGHTPVEVYQELWKTIKSGQQWRGQFLNRKKNGDMFWEDIGISPVFDEQGSITQFVAIKEDITARKEAEQRLRESESSLNRSQELALVGDWTWYTQTNTVRWSDEMYRIFGVDQASFTGDLNAVITAAIHPDDRASVFAANQAVLDENKPNALEYRVIWKDGSIHYIWAQPGDRVLDEQGNIVSLSGIVQDITERKLAELAVLKASQELATLHQAVEQQNIHLEQTVNERTAQLRHLNDRMATILNNVSDAIILLDADNHIETTNLSFDRLFGYDRDEVFGKPLRIIAALNFEQELIKAKQAVRDGHESQRVYIKAKCKDNQTFDADIAIAYVKDNGGHLICSVRDITYLKEVERAKDAFVSMVSHELRTPITAMVLGSETLSHYYDRLSDEKRLQKIAQLRQQAGVLAELVTAILDTARFDSNKAARESVPVDVRQTLREVVAELTPQAEANGQRLEVRTEEADSMIIPADHADLTRIWRNLISNAIKYTGNGSSIKAHLYAPDHAAQSATVSLPDLSLFNGSVPADIKAGKYIIGMVEDNGPGIREQDLNQLFTRFFRGWAASTDIPGTGLGLSLVKDILKAYGGDIAVHSLPDRGTTFCFWLPVNPFKQIK